MFEPLVVQLEPVRFVGVANDLRDVGRLEGVFLSAGLDPREIKNVVDQAREPGALPRNDGIVFLSLFLRGYAPGLKSLTEHPYERKGRLELVRHVGHEIGLDGRKGHLPTCQPDQKPHRRHQRNKRQ